MQLFASEDETIVGLGNRLQAGKTTSVKLIEDCFRQIDALEPEIHAWVILDRESALKQAQAADTERSRGESNGLLHGIPIGIKDIIDVAGFPTRAGSALLSDSVVDQDAPVIAKLRSAGAIVLGKTVTTQFAFFDPPKTVNPWNHKRTPGGSSSGSAAAVASGMCPGALGSQTGGSISRPASFCGVMGCKPTFGRVSTKNVFPISARLDHVGPIARSVTDLALLLDVMSDTPQTGPSLTETLNSGNTSNEANSPRLGRLTGFFDALADSEMRTAVERVCGLFADKNAQVVETTLPACFDELHACHRTIMLFDAARIHAKNLAQRPDEFATGLRNVLNQGQSISGDDYEHCCDHQDRTRLEGLQLFEDADILICPASIGPAPDASTTGDPALNAPWSYTGYPTISIPVDLSADGLPMGIQLVARPDAEQQLFRAAKWCEEVLRQQF